MECLQDLKCTGCRSDAVRVTQAQIDHFMPQLADWHIKRVHEIDRLERTYYFHDFKEAMAFTQQVGDLAERENHHPAILTEWGRVTVTWWTHKIKGLHINDFVMAMQTDKLVKGVPS
ncbi:MAG: 4a-hydroxytetrahydrobiopterin dehydratase [Planctomycetes bacterium]|nr:4a-hydroxytetrahydrobiopterin dehydratase [Planctomycetota bacterium]